MGLQEMLAEIKKESEQENEEILKRAKTEADKLVIVKLEELDKKYEKQRELFEIKLKQMRLKLSAKVELEVYREKEKKEFELIERLIEESFNELVKYLRTNKEIYFKFLQSLIDSAKKSLDSDEIEVSFSKEEDDIIKEFEKGLLKEKIKVLSSSSIKGGVICSSGKSYIDYSIENIYKAFRQEVLKIITKALSYNA